MGGDGEQTGTCYGDPWCILTYDGSLVDMALNYVVLLVSISAAFVLVNGLHSAGTPERRAHRWRAGASIAFVSAFQVVLCLAVGCAGVSVVWNAAIGSIATMIFLRRPPRRRALGRQELAFITAALVLAAAVDVWYLVTDEELTTLAHGCALVLGAIIAVAELCILGGSGHDHRLADPPSDT